MPRSLRQVDVFTPVPYLGNPVAVVLDGEGLTPDQMQTVARWTNLSETTFVLPPTDPAADYRVRIFTPLSELPFAGHPTLGTCHAWLEAGGSERVEMVQQCEAGLVAIKRTADGLAFQAPPLRRGGRPDEADIERIRERLGVSPEQVVDAQWADNGPGFIALQLRSAEDVLRLKSPPVDAPVGVIGAYPAGSAAAFEVRAFVSDGTSTFEDPATGSLNAALGQWFVGAGKATAPYVVSQGTAIGRRARIHISADSDGSVWVGGGTITCIAGAIEI